MISPQYRGNPDAQTDVARPIITQEAIARCGDRFDIVLVDRGSHRFHVESPKETAELLTEVAE